MNLSYIGFIGPKGSGKSVAASYFVNQYDYVNHFFAKPVKKMIECLGVPLENIYGALKEDPCKELCGESARVALATLGTEWGRCLISPNIWIQAWKNTLPPKANVVCDDIRFPNEADEFRALGGVVIDISRPSVARVPSHESESYSLSYDFQAVNDGSLKDLYAKLEIIYKEINVLHKAH